MKNKEVIEAEKTLSQLFKKLKGEDYRKYEFMKVPEFDICYDPLF